MTEVARGFLAKSELRRDRIPCFFSSSSEVNLQIVDVQQFLAQQGDTVGPLQLGRLSALRPSAAPYSALLCQAHGTIDISETRIGNSDSQAVLPMYRAFLAHAVESHAQLVITPEYSVPWSLIEEIVQGALRPPQGALWVLGCESIAFNELDTLQTAVDVTPDVSLIHETINPQKRAQASFADPLFLYSGPSTLPVTTYCVSWSSSRPFTRATKTMLNFNLFI